MNKLKIEYLTSVRFKCNNVRCQYQLTYDELVLGTHELDDCSFIKIVCEGCGAKITKQEQIRHDAVDCSNPHAKCKYCKTVFHLKQLIEHERNCEMKSLVKLEYNQNEEAALNNLIDEDLFEAHNGGSDPYHILPKKRKLYKNGQPINKQHGRTGGVPSVHNTKHKGTVLSSQIQNNPLKRFKSTKDANTELIKNDQDILDIMDCSDEDENSGGL